METTLTFRLSQRSVNGGINQCSAEKEEGRSVNGIEDEEEEEYEYEDEEEEEDEEGEEEEGAVEEQEEEEEGQEEDVKDVNGVEEEVEEEDERHENGDEVEEEKDGQVVDDETRLEDVQLHLQKDDHGEDVEDEESEYEYETEEEGEEDDEEEGEEDDEEEEDKVTKESMGQSVNENTKEKSQENGNSVRILDEKLRKCSTDSMETKDSSDPLDNMLERIQRLREERKKILRDMNLLKSDDDDKTEVTSDYSTDIKCFICDATFTKLNLASIMHMGLEDGEPICPKALFLTEKSREKLQNVVGANHLTVEQKYAWLRTTILEREDEDVTGQETVQEAEAFLDQMVRRSSLESHSPVSRLNSTTDLICFICGEVFPKMNRAAVMHMGLKDGDPICPRALFLTDSSRDALRKVSLMEELSSEEKFERLKEAGLEMAEAEERNETDYDFLELMEAKRGRDQEELQNIRDGVSELSVKRKPYSEMLRERNRDLEEATQSKKEEEETLEIRREATPEMEEEVDEDVESKMRAMLDDLRASSPRRRLNAVASDDRSSPVDKGKVLRADLAPPVALRGYRELMRQISGEKRELRRVHCHDRSAPFIPKDIEIFCVGDAPKKSQNTKREKR